MIENEHTAMKKKISFKPLIYLAKTSLCVCTLLGVTLLSGCQSNKKDNSFTVTGQRVETRMEPILSDEVQPRFSWEIASDQRALEQSYYQLMVASSFERLEGDTADIWDSGRIKSGQSIQVPYDGPALQSMSTYYWKVRVWCKGRGVATSGIMSWSTGLLQEKDWKAYWIGLDSITPDDTWMGDELFLAARYLRREFTLDDQPERANLYVTGVGNYRIYLNGLPLGGHVITPTSTDQSQLVTYTSYEMAPFLSAGKNVFGVVLGNGSYAGSRTGADGKPVVSLPRLLFQLELTKKDGTRSRLVSDATWKVTSAGSIRENHLAFGESIDATRDLTGCFKAGYDDGAWLFANLMKDPGTSQKPVIRMAQKNEDMSVVYTTKPVAVIHQRAGSFILDMGQNLSGWLKFQIKGDRGRAITLRYAERLNPDSTLDRSGLSEKQHVDQYTLKGGGVEEMLSPSFSYHGFRYVEVLNWPGEPNKNLFTAEMISDGFSSTGSFQSSSTYLNTIYGNAWWTVAGNYKGVPFDCSNTALQKASLVYRSNSCVGESYLFDNQRLYAKWLTDIRLSMSPLGQIPDAAPAVKPRYSDNVTGAATYFLVARMLYRQFADKKAVEDNYSSMKKWMSYMEKHRVRNGLINGDSFGDPGVPPLVSDSVVETRPDRLTDGTLIATAYYIKLLQVMQEFADLLGKETDKGMFASREASMCKAFQRKFYHENAYYYANNTVTANLLPLAFGITPQDDRKAVFDHVCRVIDEKNNAHLSTGVIGTSWLLQTLSENGRPDLALRLATNRTYPSWCYMAEHGATTFWERWNTDKTSGINASTNHVAMVGDVLNWCYENVAGIRCAPDGPGFKQIIMRPDFPDGLTFVKCTYKSAHGMVVSNWERKGIHLDWEIVVPHNTNAFVYIPAPRNQVYEGETPASKAAGVTFVKTEGDRSVFKVGSGTYRFKVAR